MNDGSRRWPRLSYADWSETALTLQLWTQIVGKVRLALTPWLNHSWHVPFYVTARGLGTTPIPAGDGSGSISGSRSAFVTSRICSRSAELQFRTKQSDAG